MITDVHDAITSLSAHGKELPVGLTQEMKDEIDRLVSCLACRGARGWGGEQCCGHGIAFVGLDSLALLLMLSSAACMCSGAVAT